MTNKIILTLAMAFAGVTAINARNTSVEPISKTTSFEESLPVVITQNASFLMPGQEIQVNVAANVNSTSRLKEITINGMAIVLKDGAASCKFSGGGLGVHEIPVKVSFFDKNDELQTRTYNVKYEVGQPNTSIALDKMNVLYIGVDNPISIASSTSGELTVSTEGGGSSITRIGPGPVQC